MNVSVSIGQNFDRVSNGQSLNTTIKLASCEFNVQTIDGLNWERLAWTFTNNLFSRFENREEGAKLPFSLSKSINMKVKVDGQLMFDLGHFAAMNGVEIKFPSHLARKDAKAAKQNLAKTFLYVIETALQFADDCKNSVVSE